MTLPDGNTVAVLVVNVVGYAWVWVRTRRKDSTDDALHRAQDSVRSSQHSMMWTDYKKRHGITNGEGRA